jgi:hypothetical protein
MPTTAIDDCKSVVPNAGRKASGHTLQRRLHGPSCISGSPTRDAQLGACRVLWVNASTGSQQLRLAHSQACVAAEGQVLCCRIHHCEVEQQAPGGLAAALWGHRTYSLSLMQPETETETGKWGASCTPGAIGIGHGVAKGNASKVLAGSADHSPFVLVHKPARHACILVVRRPVEAVADSRCGHGGGLDGVWCASAAANCDPAA